MITKDKLMKSYGIRARRNLLAPNMHPTDKLEIPRGTMIHTVPYFGADDDDTRSGPEVSDIPLSKVNYDLYIKHVEKMSVHAQTRKVKVNTKALILDYHKRNPTVRNLRKASNFKDTTSLVISHGIAAQTVAYKDMKGIAHIRFNNLKSTMWHSLEKYGKGSLGLHLIPLTVPTILPDLVTLRKVIDDPKSVHYTNTKDYDEFNLMDLFCWYGNGKSTYPETLTDIQLLVLDGDRFSILDLGMMNDWRLEDDGDVLPLFKYFSGIISTRISKTSDIALQADSGDEHVAAKVVSKEVPKATISNGCVTKATRLAEQGVYTPAEVRRIDRLSKKYTTIPNPMGKGTLEDLITIPPESLEHKPTKIPEIKAVLDKSMLKSTLIDFDSRYIKDVMDADIAAMAVSMQKAGFMVTNYKCDVEQDALTKAKVYKVQYTPVGGAPSTLTFKLPFVEPDGTFTTGGVTSRLNKQRGDLPIRKTAAATVALTTYYGKNFVTRSPKTANDYGQWLTKSLTTIGLDVNDKRVSSFSSGIGIRTVTKVPRAFSILANNFLGITIAGIKLDLNVRGYATKYTKDELKVPTGHFFAGKGVSMDSIGVVYKAGKAVGTIPELAELDMSKAPNDIVEIKILGKSVPIIVVLGYHLGIQGTLDLLKTKFRLYDSIREVPKDDSLLIIRFKDTVMTIPRSDEMGALIFGGLNTFKNDLKNVTLGSLSKKDAYYQLTAGIGVKPRHFKEYDLMLNLFIDPISEAILKKMKEPTDFIGLLVRSVDLMTKDTHPLEVDTKYMRIRGYERMSGMVYTQLVSSARDFERRAISSSPKLEMNPRAVWMDIIQDASVTIIEESNPIHEIKEKELVTYGGAGGRTGQSMVRKTRQYHENDIGVISESTPDSGKVAMTTFLSANPNLSDLRGMIGDVKDADGLTSRLSTAAMNAPACTHDDIKRTNFISIQLDSAMSAVGYSPSAVRTGYEQVIAHRAGDKFAYTAKDDGKVLEVSDKHLKIKSVAGDGVIVELGTRHGGVVNKQIPHVLVCDLKKGQSYKKGDVLVFNKGFFCRDFFNPMQVTWLAGVVCKTALMESNDTLEDASVISKRISGKMSTRIAKIKTITLDFGQSISRLVKVGDTVAMSDNLCIIEDGVTSASNIFDDSTLDTLSLLAAQSPKAGTYGTIDKIECFYFGDKADMSESLRKLATASDKVRKERVELLKNGEAITGSLKEKARLGSTVIEDGNMVLQVYISKDVSCGTGDKVVYSSQLKSTISRILNGTNTTLAGDEIDAIFSYMSISNRIVHSPEIIGTTNTLLRVLGKKVAEAYRG